MFKPQFLVCFLSPTIGAFQDMSSTCPHQYYPNTSPSINLTLSKFFETEISPNTSHFFHFQNYQFLNSDKNILFKLEPCRGIVDLYIRRTRPCWPDPWTDTWYHYKSASDGGASLFEIPAMSSQWFITVYAKTSSRYALTIVPHVVDYPRITQGQIKAIQLAKDSVEIQWNQAVADTPILNYIVYSSLFLESSLSYTTVCGLQENTDHPYAVTSCFDSICKFNISRLSNNRRYIFNIVALNKLTNLRSVYDGIVVKTVWDESFVDQVLEIAQTGAIVIATVTCVLIASYFFIIYNY